MPKKGKDMIVAKDMSLKKRKLSPNETEVVIHEPKDNNRGNTKQR